MSQKFDCPNCCSTLNAPHSGETTLRCPFCNSSVIVPEAARTHPAPQVEVVISQGGESDQVVSPPVASFSFPPVDASTAQKTVRRTASTSCLIIGVTLGIFLVIGIFIVFAMTAPGGPLQNTWAKINPVAFANLTLEFGGEGSGPGLFTDVRALAVDNASGNIYAADYQGGRVQAIDSNGKFILQWNVGDRKTIITSMAADRKGTVYVTAGGKILVYDGSTGKLMGEVPHVGELSYYEYVVTTADGGLVAVDSDETIVKLDVDLNPVLTLPNAVETISGDSELDTQLAVDGAGNVYALGLFNDAIFKFGADGKFINRFGSEGDQPGQFQSPDALAVDGKGRVFVSDMGNIQVFDSDGRYLRSFDVDGVAFGMVFTDQGELLLTTNSQKVLKYKFNE